MITRIRDRLAQERGFTLVELLVIMVIIGILAAIALTVFLGQQTKANDAAAKDDAAALGVDVQTCFQTDESYANCTTPSQLGDNSLDFDTTVTPKTDCTQDPGPADTYPDPQAGMVAVLAASDNCYLIEAVSKDGHLFWILKRASVAAVRGCEPAGQGSCSSSSTWG